MNVFADKYMNMPPDPYDRPYSGEEAIGAVEQRRAAMGAPPSPPQLPAEGQPWYNKLGERAMQIAEDPRNQWIGMGPMAGMAKIPKAAQAAKAQLQKSARNLFPDDPKMQSSWVNKWLGRGVGRELPESTTEEFLSGAMSNIKAYENDIAYYKPLLNDPQYNPKIIQAAIDRRLKAIAAQRAEIERRGLAEPTK